MVAQFKINDKVILTDSGGTRNLFVDGSITFNDSDGKTLTLRNTKKTLTQDFFTNYFHGFQGETSGYTSGGSVSPPYSGSRKNTIDKFPFSSDTNASDVGDLTEARTSAGGQSSIAHGYSSGGAKDPGPTEVNIIDKFPFAVDGNATDVGDLLAAIKSVGGQSSPSNGYTTGGEYSNVIQKFPFSVDANSSDVGDLTVTRKGFGGHSSLINGYNSGGEIESGPALSNVIDKFPFAVDGNATDVGDLTQSRVSMGSQSSSPHGY